MSADGTRLHAGELKGPVRTHDVRLSPFPPKPLLPLNHRSVCDSAPGIGRDSAPVPIGHCHSAVDLAQKVLVLQDVPAVPRQEVVDGVDPLIE